MALLARSPTGSLQIFISLDDEGHSGDQGEGLYCHRIKFKRDNTLYEGVEIVTRVTDTRDASKELYDLCFKEGTNEMIFFKPAMEACMRFDKALIDPRILAQDANDTYLIDGRDAACVSFGKKVKAKPDLERRRFEVYLPDHFKISQRAFDNPVGRDGVFQSAVSKTYMYRIPFEPARGNTARGAVCPDTFHVFLSWKFINYQSNTELALPAATMVANLNAAFAGL